MDKVEKILIDLFGVGEWSVKRTAHRSRKECFVATSGQKRVFIKFDTDVCALERLTEIGVAPTLLAHGESEGVNHIVQQFIDGEHPTREWIRSHIKETGQAFHRWHGDMALTALLEPGAPSSYAEYLDRELSSLHQRWERLESATPFSAEVRYSFHRFLTLGHSLTPAELVPVHDEPNTSNMLVSSGRLLVVDWDDIRLGDPLRDLGPFLWWYLPQKDWGRAIVTRGGQFDEGTRQKIFWFAARASLDVALWLLKHEGEDDKGFLKDFVAATHLQPNPRA